MQTRLRSVAPSPLGPRCLANFLPCDVFPYSPDFFSLFPPTTLASLLENQVTCLPCALRLSLTALTGGGHTDRHHGVEGRRPPYQRSHVVPSLPRLCCFLSHDTGRMTARRTQGTHRTQQTIRVTKFALVSFLSLTDVLVQLDRCHSTR